MVIVCWILVIWFFEKESVVVYLVCVVIVECSSFEVI